MKCVSFHSNNNESLPLFYITTRSLCSDVNHICISSQILFFAANLLICFGIHVRVMLWHLIAQPDAVSTQKIYWLISKILNKSGWATDISSPIYILYFGLLYVISMSCHHHRTHSETSQEGTRGPFSIHTQTHNDEWPRGVVDEQRAIALVVASLA